MAKVLYYNIDDNLDYEKSLLEEWGVKDIELIEIKVAPISDLILDHEVAALYANMVGKHISYESNVMPRARNKVYAKIPVANLNRKSFSHFGL